MLWFLAILIGLAIIFGVAYFIKEWIREAQRQKRLRQLRDHQSYNTQYEHGVDLSQLPSVIAARAEE